MRKLCLLLVFLMLAGCAGVQPQSSREPLRQRAEEAYEQDNYAEAVSLYTKAADKQEMAPRDWYRYGNALVQEDRAEEAISAYRQALAGDPDLAEARHNLGLVHLELGLRHLFEARRSLPEADRAAEATVRLFGCVMSAMRAMRGIENPLACRERLLED